MKHSVQELNEIAREARRVTMKCIASLGKGHVGGALDIVDALTVLYYEEMNVDPADPKKAGRDRLVLSKGHGGPGLYAILAMKGFFDMKEIYTLNKPGTMLPSHCDRLLTPGIDMKLGALTCFLDLNGQQIDAPVDDVNSLLNAADKWRSFGWNVQEVDGHDVQALYDAIESAKKCTDKPNMIVMHTVKGKGWQRIEGTTKCHSMPVTEDDLEEALRDLQ